jgi:hypothetical protein
MGAGMKILKSLSCDCLIKLKSDNLLNIGILQSFMQEHRVSPSNESDFLHILDVPSSGMSNKLVVVGSVVGTNLNDVILERRYESECQFVWTSGNNVGEATESVYRRKDVPRPNKDHQFHAGHGIPFVDRRFGVFPLRRILPSRMRRRCHRCISLGMSRVRSIHNNHREER